MASGVSLDLGTRGESDVRIWLAEVDKIRTVRKNIIRVVSQTLEHDQYRFM